MLWKARCNIIFTGASIDLHWIIGRVIDYIKEYDNLARNNMCNFMKNTLITTSFSTFLFTDAFWGLETAMGGADFLFVDSNFHILFGGCKRVEVALSLEAVGQAIGLGLRLAVEMNLKVAYAFTDSLELYFLLNHEGNKLG